MATVYGRNITPEKVSYVLDTSTELTATYNDSSVDIFKTSGVGGTWNRQAYCMTPFTAPCTIEFNKLAVATDNGLSYAMIGWNEDPTLSASYTSIDHASYPYATNLYVVYNNGSQVLASGTWNSSKKFYVVYDTDGLIRHWNGTTLLYTSASYGTGKTVYCDSAYYSPSAIYGGFSNIRLIKKAWNGTSYTI